MQEEFQHRLKVILGPLASMVLWLCCSKEAGDRPIETTAQSGEVSGVRIRVLVKIRRSNYRRQMKHGCKVAISCITTADLGHRGIRYRPGHAQVLHSSPPDLHTVGNSTT